MARSTNIYVVRRNVGGLVLSAFTVKHELIDWLRKRPANEGAVHVLRFRDGQGYCDSDDITADIFPLDRHE